MIYFKTNVSSPILYFKSGQFICEENWKHNPFVFDKDYEIIIGIKGTIYIEQGDENMS